MADFILTTGAPDSILGAAGIADTVFVTVAGALAGTDTVTGGSSPLLFVRDRLVITAPMTLLAADFANTRQFEALEIAGAFAVTATLDDAMVASGAGTAFEVLAGNADTVILGGAILARSLAMTGGLGNDRFEGGGGADTLKGGGGNDTIASAVTALTAGDLIDGGLGLDTLRLTSAGSIGAAAFARISGIERIEVLAFLGGLNLTFGAGFLLTEALALTVQTGIGDDSIAAGGFTGAMVVLSAEGADQVTGGGLADSIDGGAGTDVLTGGAGADSLDGGDGNDRLRGGTGSDLLRGGAGDDTITGGSGNDTIEAGAGIDRIDPGTGNDLVLIAGADVASTDFIVDEAGTLDTLQFTGAAPVGFGITLSGRFVGFERVLFGDGNDLFAPTNLFGDAVETDVVTVEGGAGDDTLSAADVARIVTPLGFLLRGGDGLDSLVGGVGNDTLDPGAGVAALLGGGGDDVLIVRTADMAGAPVLNGGANSIGSLLNDTLRLIGGGSLDASVFANTTRIETLDLAPEGMSVVIPDSLVASGDSVIFRVQGGAGDDLVDGSTIAGNSLVYYALGEGDDTVIGGAAREVFEGGTGMDSVALGTGNDRAAFGADELSALDTVVADSAAGDVLEVTVAAGRTLGTTAFAGVQGFDAFVFSATGVGAAVRLPSTLISQSGRNTVTVEVSGTTGMVIDGRGASGGWSGEGGAGDDLIYGGSGANALDGQEGSDTMIGGSGGDSILLGADAAAENWALFNALTDGTADINGTLSTGQLGQADRVTGLADPGNFIVVDIQALALSGGSAGTIFAGADITSVMHYALLPTTTEVTGNAFGDLAAVRGAVIAGGHDILTDIGHRMIIAIGGADETQFGLYLFQDGDGNATIDVADTLRLLAIGDTDVPQVLGPQGFRAVFTAEIG